MMLAHQLFRVASEQHAGLAVDVLEAPVAPQADEAVAHALQEFDDALVQGLARAVALHQLQGEADVGGKFVEQVKLGGIEELGLLRVEIEGAERPAFHHDRKGRRGAIIQCQRRFPPGSHARILGNVVADDMPTLAQGEPRGAMAMLIVASRDVQPIQIVAHLPGVGRRANLAALRIGETQPGHAEAADLDRDAAGLAEQRVGVAQPHDGPVDAAQNRWTRLRPRMRSCASLWAVMSRAMPSTPSRRPWASRRGLLMVSNKPR